MYGGKRRPQHYPSPSPASRAPRVVVPSPTVPLAGRASSSKKFCGLSCARLLIYGLLLGAHTLLMLVLGASVGRAWMPGSFAAVAGGAGGPTTAAAAGAPAAAPAAAAKPFDASKPFIAPVAEHKADVHAEAAKVAGTTKGRQPPPAHLSQASANHPGAADVPLGWVYAKDKTSKDRASDTRGGVARVRRRAERPDSSPFLPPPTGPFPDAPTCRLSPAHGVPRAYGRRPREHGIYHDGDGRRVRSPCRRSYSVAARLEHSQCVLHDAPPLDQ